MTMTHSPLAQSVLEHVNACFTGIWITSHEHDEAELDLSRLARERQWALYTWDCDRGIRSLSGGPQYPDATDPLAALKAFPTLSPQAETCVIVLRNYHKFLGSADVMQCVDTQLAQGRVTRRFVVVLGYDVQLPPELSHQFVTINHDLPTRDQLQQIAGSLSTEPGDMPEGKALEQLLDAAAGLTRIEAEGAFALSLGRYGAMRPDTVWELKESAMRRDGLLTLHRGRERFADLGGLDAVKTFCLRALHSRGRHKAQARGIMLLGVPGTGKSAFAKALGAETQRPTVTLDVGALLGSLMGESEANTRKALKSIDAMAPCILFLDEVEKAFAGADGGGRTDSGVGSRIFGTFLTWLNDHTSDVFVVATSNKIAHLPSAFTRSKRFDGIWFLDFPDPVKRSQIWGIHREAFAIDPEMETPNDHDWTGAEIEACCRLADLLDFPLAVAANYVVPVASTAHEDVTSLRTWAEGRALCADSGERFRTRRVATDPRKSTSPDIRPSRKVRRPDDQSSN
jgi:hypothetical protein